MFRTLFIAATLLPMLFHSVLGCCWHHAHSVKTVESSSVRCEHLHGGRHEHHEAKLHEHKVADRCCHDEFDDPCCPDKDGRNCDEEVCLYVFTEPSRTGSFGFDLMQVILFADAHMSPVASSVHSFTMALFKSAGDWPPRPRARTQVWLM